MAQNNKPGPIPITLSEILDFPSNTSNLLSCFFALLFTYRVRGLYVTYVHSSLPSQQNSSSQETDCVSVVHSAIGCVWNGAEICGTFLSEKDDGMGWKSECNGVSKEKS